MTRKLSKVFYEQELLKVQRELVKLQDHVQRTGMKVCVIWLSL